MTEGHFKLEVYEANAHRGTYNVRLLMDKALWHKSNIAQFQSIPFFSDKALSQMSWRHPVLTQGNNLQRCTSIGATRGSPNELGFLPITNQNPNPPPLKLWMAKKKYAGSGIFANMLPQTDSSWPIGFPFHPYRKWPDEKDNISEAKWSTYHASGAIRVDPAVLGRIETVNPNRSIHVKMETYTEGWVDPKICRIYSGNKYGEPVFEKKSVPGSRLTDQTAIVAIYNSKVYNHSNPVGEFISGVKKRYFELPEGLYKPGYLLFASKSRKLNKSPEGFNFFIGNFMGPNVGFEKNPEQCTIHISQEAASRIPAQTDYWIIFEIKNPEDPVAGNPRFGHGAHPFPYASIPILSHYSDTQEIFRLGIKLLWYDILKSETPGQPPKSIKKEIYLHSHDHGATMKYTSHRGVSATLITVTALIRAFTQMYPNKVRKFDLSLDLKVERMSFDKKQQVLNFINSRDRQLISDPYIVNNFSKVDLLMLAGFPVVSFKRPSRLHVKCDRCRYQNSSNCSKHEEHLVEISIGKSKSESKEALNIEVCLECWSAGTICTFLNATNDHRKDFLSAKDNVSLSLRHAINHYRYKDNEFPPQMSIPNTVNESDLKVRTFCWILDELQKVTLE
jgi:hypothetical protein